MKRGNPSGWKAVISSPLSLIAALIIVVFLTRAAWNMSMKAGVSSEKLAQASSGLDRLKDRQAALAAQISLLSTDNGVEGQLRTKYPAVKEGESVAIIVDDPGIATTAPSVPTAASGWWSRMLHMIGL